MKTISKNDIFTYASGRLVIESEEPKQATAAIDAVLTANGFTRQRQINSSSAVFEKDCLMLEDKTGIPIKLIASVIGQVVTIVLQYMKKTAPVVKSFKYDLMVQRSSNNIWVRLAADARQLGIDLNRTAPRGF